MSASRGTRRLLIALSGLYWVVALALSAVVSFRTMRQCIHDLPLAPAVSDALHSEMFSQCRNVFAPYMATLMGCALILFGAIWAIYLTVRWIIRGFRAAA